MSREAVLTDSLSMHSGDESITLLDELLDSSIQSACSPGPPRIHGAVIGEVTGRDATGRLAVRTLDPPLALEVSHSTVPAAQLTPGAPVVLLFQQGDPARPIVVGVLQSCVATSAAASESTTQPRGPELPISAIVDDQRLVIQAQQEIVLQCGKASITLTRAGKVLLRGAYVSSRSSGVNRIKGGSVQIN